ncbi:class I SAM-dependent methyltransferase [Pollutimonas sp. H1-120]|uniref:class I SAM-dependent methyltransferase n=1 Tax=Pollutimonas sp. H1-120 TaxID=3148824 RepID=UPI003B52ECA6
MDKSKKNGMLADVAKYYTAKIVEHGDTPQGVDWNGSDSQELRFKQLSKCIAHDADFSLNDFGCGYGAYYEFLAKHYIKFRYNGCDVSGEMIAAAKKRYSDHSSAFFEISAKPTTVADYGVASGIFNVRLQHSADAWLTYIKNALQILDSTSRKGFAFNCLTKYSDKEKMRDHLYYADPCFLFDYCKSHFSRNVALLHDYDLYEFTLLVRKKL